MESSSMVERALKSGFRSKAEGQHVVAVEDGLLGVGAVSLVACNDDFVVDDLFDFSYDDGEVEEEEEEEEVEEEEEEEENDDDEGQEAKESLCVSSQEGDDDCSNLSSSSSASGEPILASELTVPDVDIAELEWLSQFVDDDSLPEFSTCHLTGKWKQESSAKNRPEQEPRPVFIRPPCFPSPVPVKIRTKRTRALRKDRPPSSSESSSTSSCSSENTSSSCLSFTSVLTRVRFVPGQSEPEKKKKMKTTRGSPVQFQRRCSHCQVQRTPQWRAGPLGPKTLCNACGVRYKSGRLFPEYRPACSPTFSVEAHSNSHRKVLDMRKKKEMAGNGIGGGGLKLNRIVTSF
ncbi:GATA transcription factor 5-like [Rhodamnia argentea]|uniref:GATA transcription factor n=1 Tax=Rhodamnia argentea TaxID=178133 RepID=A0A8B8PBG5_9MYRT|nr:GATA transcription factor 5-like [Rhodamnia argentea]XP_048134950.1 GATA transcription factor 5-like [Rhodamnia argentea]